MMCVGPRQRAARQNAEAPAGPAPAIPTMGLPGGPQARFPAGRPPIPEHQRPPISVTAHRAQSFALHQPGLQHAAVNNPAPPPPPPPFRPTGTPLQPTPSRPPSPLVVSIPFGNVPAVPVPAPVPAPAPQPFQPTPTTPPARNPTPPPAPLPARPPGGGSGGQNPPPPSPAPPPAAEPQGAGCTLGDGASQTSYVDGEAVSVRAACAPALLLRVLVIGSPSAACFTRKTGRRPLVWTLCSTCLRARRGWYR